MTEAKLFVGGLSQGTTKGKKFAFILFAFKTLPSVLRLYYIWVFM